MARGAVCITGVGVLSPLGLGLQELAQGLARGDFEPGPPTAFDAMLYAEERAAEVPPVNLKELRETPKTYLDRCSALALAACYLAVRDASLEWHRTEPERRGLSHGTCFGCLESLFAVTERMREQGTRAASPMIFTHSFANSPASLLAIEYSVRGPGATFADGALSGAEAVEYGCRRTAADAVDFCLAGGAEALSEQVYAALDESGRLSEGLVVAEGAAMLGLEPVGRAEARGARVRGKIVGCAVAASVAEALMAVGASSDDVWQPPVDWGHAFGAQFPLLLAAALCAPEVASGGFVAVVQEEEMGAAAALLEVGG